MYFEAGVRTLRHRRGAQPQKATRHQATNHGTAHHGQTRRDDRTTRGPNNKKTNPPTPGIRLIKD